MNPSPTPTILEIRPRRKKAVTSARYLQMEIKILRHKNEILHERIRKLERKVNAQAEASGTAHQDSDT